MRNIVTRGIIISRRNYKEADRILIVYTERLGKISVLAKGVRKSTSKLGGHLELFNISRLELEEGKNWYILTGAQTEKNFAKIRLNLPKISAGFFIAELISHLTVENDVNRSFFKVIENGFKILNKSKKEIVANAFVWQLVNQSGYHPELYNCVICNKKLNSSEIAFSSIKGGLVDNCNVVSDAIAIEPDTVKLIRVATKNIDIFHQLIIPKKNIKEFNLITKIYISNIIEREIKSEKFIEIANKLI